MNKNLLSKNYVFIVVSATLFYTASFMVNAVCGRYAIDIGASKTVAGAVACAFTLSSFFTRPVWGYFADKKGRRLVYFAGGALCLASAILLIFTKNIPLLFGARIIFGGGYSALTTAGGTIVCDVVPDGSLKQAIAFYGVTNVLSQAVAPAAALWLFDLGFVWVAWVVTGLMALVIVTALFVKYREKDFINKDIKFRIVEKTALPAAYTIIFFAMSTSAVNSFIPVMAQERNISHDGMFFVISAVFLLLSRVVNTRLTNKFGENKIFYTGDIIYILSFVLTAFAYGPVFLLVGAGLYGVGAGFIHPIVNTAAVKNCKSENRGLATGTFMMSQDLGMTIGALSWGFLSEKLGFTAVYLIVAGLLLVMMYVFKAVLAAVLE